LLWFLKNGLHAKAQWLSGIGTGAWFELHYVGKEAEYEFTRVSPNGNIDIHSIFKVNDNSFNYNLCTLQIVNSSM